MVNKKHKTICTTLDYMEYFLFLASTIGCISISAFASLLGIPIEITSSAIGLKTCAIAAEIKSIIKKKKHDKIVLLAKSKLNCTEFLISKALINSNISHDEFLLINNVLKEFDERLYCPLDLSRVAKVFDGSRQFVEDFSLFIKLCYHIVFQKKNQLKICN